MARRPNIILLTVDSLRPDHLGCYGYGRSTSLRLDALAETACVFDAAWATGPSTPFSFPGLMASRMPFESRGFGIREAPLTLAEALRSRGYCTRAFNAANPYVSDYFGYGRGFDRATDFMEHKPADLPVFQQAPPAEHTGVAVPRRAALCRRAVGAVRRAVRAVPAVHRLAKRVPRFWGPAVDRALDESRLQAKEALEERFYGPVRHWLRHPPQQPFFLWLHAMTVHEPYVPPAWFQQAVSGRVLTRGRVRGLRRLAALEAEDHARMSARDRREFAGLYDAEVRHFDEEFAGLLDALQAAGLLESSLLIVTADHGEQLFEHGGVFHPSRHYNELLRVPLIVRLPGQSRGRRVKRQVSLLDVMPTLCELAGADIPQGACLGQSLAPALAGQGDAPDGRLHVAESYYGDDDFVLGLELSELASAGRRVSFQNANLKLIVDCTGGRCEAYDLRRDPMEQRDLCPDNPELARIGLRLARVHLRDIERRRARRACADTIAEHRSHGSP